MLVLDAGNRLLWRLKTCSEAPFPKTNFPNIGYEHLAYSPFNLSRSARGSTYVAFKGYMSYRKICPSPYGAKLFPFYLFTLLYDAACSIIYKPNFVQIYTSRNTLWRIP